MSRNEAAQIESIVLQFPSISTFLGIWLTKEIEKVRQSKSHHVFVDRLASPYGYVVAKETAIIFDTILSLASRQHPLLRKKVIQKTSQADFEALWFELEIDALFLQHGYATELEPLGRKRRGPDLRTLISGHDTYIEVKKLQHDAETARLWKTGDSWSRTRTEADLNIREWDLHDRYLVSNQFPDDGLHVLAIDTSRQGRSDDLMLRAWQYYSDFERQQGYSNPPIHALILCRRQKENYVSWLHDLTAGAIILPNVYSSLPKGVAKSLTEIFQERSGL